MNDSSSCKCRTTAVYVLAILGTFLIMAALIWAMRHYTTPASLGVERAELRRKNLAEVRNADAEGLNTYGWVDQPKGIVRVPVTHAMKLVETEWKNPIEGWSNLVARAEKAAAVPPKAPEKPSQYE